MRIIFHYPSPLNPTADSASGIRPLRMVAAFQSIGYEVDFVTGYAAARRDGIQSIKKNISKGIKYAFMYSESRTWPTFMPIRQHLTLKPSRDFSFFEYFRRNNGRIGLFYRDIYWLFPAYVKRPFLKKQIIKLLHLYDLMQYQKHLTKLYLPSMEMANYIPLVDKNICSALPPGCIYSDSGTTTQFTHHSRINLLYVGGLGPHYQMHKLFKVLAFHQENIFFTLCTRKKEWEAAKYEYSKLLSTNIEIVHQSGDDLFALYAKADIAMLFVSPQAYWEFAAPFKMYEYLGKKKPIIASKGTLSGKFVEENKIGWSIPYQESALDSLLKKLIENPHLIEQKALACDQVSTKHSWIARAKQVEKDLKAS